MSRKFLFRFDCLNLLRDNIKVVNFNIYNLFSCRFFTGQNILEPEVSDVIACTDRDNLYFGSSTFYLGLDKSLNNRADRLNSRPCSSVDDGVHFSFVLKEMVAIIILEVAKT